MKIWILKNSEHSEPHEIFTIRELISEGEINADTPAWYEGIPEWVTLKDVPSLSGLFLSEQDDYNDSTDTAGIPIPTPLHPVQRFFARFFDIFLYRLVVVWIQLLNDINPLTPFETPLEGVKYALPYIVLDAILMHIWGTTPGKILLGVKVSTVSGHRLSIGASLLRSLRIWVLGFGMFFLWFISLPISYFMAKRLGKFVWDVPKNYQITVKPLVTPKVIVYVFSLFILSSIVSSSLPDEIKNASLEEIIEMTTPKQK